MTTLSIGSTVYVPDMVDGKLFDIEQYKVTGYYITDRVFVEVTNEYGTQKFRLESVYPTIREAIKAAERI